MKIAAAVIAMGLSLGLGAIAKDSRADVFAHGGLCLANNGGKAVMAACSMSRHNNNIRYIAGENVFFGQLQQGSQCLEMNRNGQVFFATCNFSKFQEWKFSANGQFNNADPGLCIVPSGGGLAGRPCPAAGWVNLSYSVLRVPNMNAPRGTPLAIRGNDLVNKQTGAIVASGGGNIVSGGAGSIIASGGGNIVSGGAGNVIAAAGKYSLGAISSIVAGGAGN